MEEDKKDIDLKGDDVFGQVIKSAQAKDQKPITQQGISIVLYGSEIF